MHKQVLVLLHGALANQKQFEAVKPMLSEHYNIYSFDFSGHTLGGVEHDFTIDLFKSDLLKFLEGHGLEQVNIFGYSMGGYVALKAALEQPKRFKKIVTLATKFDWNEESAAKEVRMLNPEKIEEKVPKYASHLKSMYGEENWKRVVLQTGQMMMTLAQGDRLTEDDLAQIKIPCTIGVGDQDAMVSLEESEWAVQQLVNSTLVVLPSIEHPLNKMASNDLVSYIRQGLG